MVFNFFFFKQKTAYEMRISDWSSDVCSSDLRLDAPVRHQHQGVGEAHDLLHGMRDVDDRQIELALELLDERQNLLLARLVERGQGLVHQQQAGVRQQRPAQGDALLLATRPRARKSTRLNSSH